jgi:ketopantoate reductase
MEVEAIFGEPLRRAQALGVAVPHMALLAGLMRSLDARRARQE